MGTTYKIKPGDNLSSIASRYGTTVNELQKANGISNPNLIYAGKTISIPKLNANNNGGVASLDLGYKYTPFEYGAFEESEETKAAKDQSKAAEDAVANYGDFNFSKQGDYDNVYNQWMNRKDFSYDFNADALYQQYKDKYIEQGKMAMADTIGQASAMTGGYGNSYAATVGNQAYQASLSQLNDIIPELYQMAYSQYNQEGQDMLNTLGLLNSEYDKEYGLYTNQYGRLVNDRDYYNTAYNNQFNRDYGMWDSDRTLAHGEHTNEEGYKYNTYRDKVEDEQWQKTYDLSERELAMAEEAWELEKKYGYSSGSSGGSGGSSGGGSGGGGKTEPKEEPIKATETTATNRFIATHQTKDEYMRRGKNYDQFKAYIDAEIAKAQDSLSDEELMYLKQYYGL